MYLSIVIFYYFFCSFSSFFSNWYASNKSSASSASFSSASWAAFFAFATRCSRTPSYPGNSSVRTTTPMKPHPFSKLFLISLYSTHLTPCHTQQTLRNSHWLFHLLYYLHHLLPLLLRWHIKLHAERCFDWSMITHFELLHSNVLNVHDWKLLLLIASPQNAISPTW